MKKSIFKNPKVINVKVDDKFFALVDPSTKNSLRLILKEQLKAYNLIDGEKNIEDIAYLVNKDKYIVKKFFDILKDANLLDYQKIPTSKPSKIKKHLNLWLHITDKCNLRCKYCYVSTLDTYKTMSKEVLDRIKFKLIEAIKKDNELKKIHLKLSGGEIFTKFDYWKEYVKDLKDEIEKRGVEASFVCLSNLTILNEEIINYLKELNIGVSVSLDGIGKYHDKNRVFINQKGTFKKVIQNLEQLEKNGIKFSISTTITNDSVEGLSELSRFMTQKNYPFRYTNAKGEFIDIQKFNYFYEKSFKIFDEYISDRSRFEKRFNQCDLEIQNPTGNICGMGKYGGAIYIDGGVYFCHTHFGKYKPLGDIFEDELLEKIIQRGAKYWENSSDECKNCPYELVCNGGCPVYRVNGKSFFCEFYQKNLPKIYALIAKERLHKEIAKRKNKNKKRFEIKVLQKA